MRVAHLAIQCKASNGETGSFLFEPNVPLPGVQIDHALLLSPVFPGLVELFRWCRMNHWCNAGYDEVLRDRSACGTYVNRTLT